MPAANSRAATVAVVLTVLFLLLLTLIAVDWHPLLSFDRGVDDTLHRWAVAHHGWTKANRVLTDWIWDPFTMRALLLAAVAWLLWRREWPLALWVALATALALVLQQGVKAAVGRQRPVWPHPVDSANNAAFPSGHVMTATVACGLLLWLAARHGVRGPVWRLLVGLAVVSVLGVGFTRVYLGVHWPSDVLGGWLLGGALVAAAIAAYPAFAARFGAPVRPYDERRPR
ncbi:phosphatase PAP2 family protein [Streptomyces palmae]|uniref:Phosphatase PAP2 family protein n=1 Tax=Streptomyces palmae TaxID=1701085 RepID=A0A4Z0HFL0_9ACTN|nr:phosphatase PAP2 family protein [Streptomyces palmae]TGB18279.1 phosphatase PAP2 family protein [Streptomyces palmae]